MCHNQPLETKKHIGLCYTANKLYCDYYGYDFYFFDLSKKYTEKIKNICPKTKRLRFISWNKILCVSQIMQKSEHDYVMYIDCDAFLIQRNSLCEIFNLKNDITFISNYPYVFDYINQSNFVDMKNYSYKICDQKKWSNVPCSGCFILKNNERNLNFLRDWYYQTPNTHENYLLRPWDQAGLWDLFLQRIYDIKVLESEGFLANVKHLSKYKETKNIIHSSIKTNITYEFVQNFYSNLNEKKVIETIKKNSSCCLSLDSL